MTYDKAERLVQAQIELLETLGTPGANLKANLVDVVRADWGQLSFTKGN
jgi:hypothetical protein